MRTADKIVSRAGVWNFEYKFRILFPFELLFSGKICDIIWVRIRYVSVFAKIQEILTERGAFIFMERKTYIPRPIDTTDVSLPEEISELVELLAENCHEEWAAQRISQGWKYGEKRDDLLKETPCLVPYGELPEEEKEYDRITTIQTLKLIRKLGYEIRK